jgi:hypothetical protein
MDEFGVGKLLRTKLVVIGLLLSDSASDNTPELTADFSAAACLFSAVSDFAIFNSSIRRLLLSSKRIPAKLPALLFFVQGALVTSARIAKESDVLIEQINTWVDPNVDPVLTLDELFSKLGNLPLTYLFDEKNWSDSAQILTGLYPHLPPMDCVIVRGDVIRQLGFENETHILFRAADRTLTPVNNSLASLDNASFPSGGRLTADDFDHARLIGVYSDEKYDRERHRALYEINEQFREIQFGVIERSEFEKIERLVPPIGTVPDFLIVAYSEGSYFPIDGLRGLDIQDPSWRARVIDYTAAVLNGSVQKSYVSETVNETADRGALKKLTGRTYREFIEDPRLDVAVLFYAAFDSENVETGEFQAAAAAVVDSGVATMKFGFMNVFRNACQQPIPATVRNPQINLFPANNKTVSIPYFGDLTKEGILRFLKENAAMPIDVQTIPLSKLDAFRERDILWNQMMDFPEDVLPYANDYVMKLVTVINPPEEASQSTSTAEVK